MENQVKNEYNKDYRKTAEFQKDIAEESRVALGEVIQKFMDNEAEQFKKDQIINQETDYDMVFKAASKSTLDLSLSGKVVEIDMDASRRWMYSMVIAKKLADEGKRLPLLTPLKEGWLIQNNDTQSHEWLVKVAATLSKTDGVEKIDVPAMGEDFLLTIPYAVKKYTDGLAEVVQADMAAKAEAESDEAALQWAKAVKAETIFNAITEKLGDYYTAEKSMTEFSDGMRNLYASMKMDPKRTKADVIQDLWKVLPKYLDQPPAPLDAEVLEELSKVPAWNAGDVNWGAKSKVYKSQATDIFGDQYLLGVYETVKEAEEAFVSWNAEYEAARKISKEALIQAGKEEELRIDADTAVKDRIKEIDGEARAQIGY